MTHDFTCTWHHLYGIDNFPCFTNEKFFSTVAWFFFSLFPTCIKINIQCNDYSYKLIAPAYTLRINLFTFKTEVL